MGKATDSRTGAQPFSRRRILRLGAGLAVAAASWPVLQACGGDGDSQKSPASGGGQGQNGVRTVHMGGPAGELAFIPDRLTIEPGEAVRWVVQSAGHSTTAYHPDSHELYESRIPAAAKPWDSGVLLSVGEDFEHRFDEPGVYQYYCIPHEGAGMVGTIVVGAAAEGPGTSAVQKEVPVAARTKLEELVEWAKQQS